MINDYSVLIRYKNKKLENVGESVYSFNVYTNMVSQELKSCLNEIEESFRTMLGEDCDLKNNESFMSIRRQILNAANSVARLPDTMCYKGTPIKAIAASDFIAKTIDSI